MADSGKDQGRSMRLGVEDWGRSSTARAFGGRMIKRSDDVVCSLHRAQGDEERRFLTLVAKPRSTVSPGSASKPMAKILVVWPQNHSHGFPGLDLKIGSYVFMIWPTKLS
jgi:hypothetical protein